MKRQASDEGLQPHGSSIHELRHYGVLESAKRKCPAHAVRYSVHQRLMEHELNGGRDVRTNKTSRDVGSRTFSAEGISMRQTRYLALSSSTICPARRSGASKSSSTTSAFTAPPFQTSRITEEIVPKETRW